MFSRARITLTLLYSAIFLACFWAFSFGLFAWMERSFEVEIGEQMSRHPAPAGSDPGETIIDFNEAALDQLYFILVVLNAALVVVILAVSWYLTGRTLAPMQIAHDAQRQFVSDAAHELRTPLAILHGEIELALRKERSDAEYRAVLSSSQQEIARLSNLAEQLLFLAGHGDRREKLVPEDIDLTDLVSAVIAAHRTLIAEKKLNITFNPPEESVVIRGDQLMLFRLFSNLLDNAVKYTPDSGRIDVTIVERDANILVEIADTGIGIAPDMHEKIFDRFARADVSRSETKGHGLGLSISRAIAARHGATIRLASRLGQGSSFTVVFARS